MLCRKMILYQRLQSVLQQLIWNWQHGMELQIRTRSTLDRKSGFDEEILVEMIEKLP